MVAPYPSAAPAMPAPGGDPTAVFGRRILAFIVDALLLGLPALFILTASFDRIHVDNVQNYTDSYCEDYMDAIGGFCADTSDLNDYIYFTEDFPVAPAILSWGGSFLLAVVLQGLTGWTPGKLVMGLRTVKEDGSVVGVGKAFLRWILLLADGQPCGLPLVGLITAGTTTGHRRVGDMAAKTYVVRSSAAGSPILVPGQSMPATPGYGDTWSQGAPPPGAGWGPSPTPSPSSWDQPVAPAPVEQQHEPWATPGDAASSGWGQGEQPTQAAPAGGDGPQWDQARGTYIQWDASQGRWLQWDEASKRWDVIPGQ